MSGVKASQVIDWTHRRGSYVFTPRNGGLQGTLFSWGRAPNIGDVLALANGDKASCYRVTRHLPGHVAADYDGYTVDVEFIPGSSIERDTP